MDWIGCECELNTKDYANKKYYKYDCYSLE